MPHICGSTAVWVSAVATAASTALPPAASTSAPASTASGCAAQTMPRVIRVCLPDRARNVPEPHAPRQWPTAYSISGRKHQAWRSPLSFGSAPPRSVSSTAVAGGTVHGAPRLSPGHAQFLWRACAVRRRSRGRAATHHRPDRPERRRQDHPVQLHLRAGAARLGPHHLRRPRHHAPAAGPDQRARAGPHLPDRARHSASLGAREPAALRPAPAGRVARHRAAAHERHAGARDGRSTSARSRSRRGSI